MEVNLTNYNLDNINFKQTYVKCKHMGRGEGGVYIWEWEEGVS